MSGLALFTPKQISAQCPGGSVPMSTTYTNTLSASGANVYTFTMPQFNPSPGGYTLLSAVLSATATTNVTVNYQNTSTTNTADFFPTVSRTDNLKVNGSTVTNKNNVYDYDETFLTLQGTPGDNVTYGPGSTFDNSTLFSSTITNSGTLTSTYQGSGTLPITYTSTFFTNNFIPTGVTVTPAISDNITFSITYNFCNPTSLSSSILLFTAGKGNGQTVDLKWLTTNEQPGRKYYIEVAMGGQDFVPSAGFVLSDATNSDANYTYTYLTPPTATGKLYFRLRQVEVNGTATWSDIRVINLDGDGTSGFSIYPNPPSDFINLTLPGDNQDWQVDIIAADGSLVQRNYYRNSNAARVNFVRRLSAGAYFVRAVNPPTGRHYSGSFLVR
jgi:hypothetical protein